jgi:xylan 1,4-beta-xylosidase
MYASYTASSFAKMYELADQHGINFEGALSWSFQFENQPWFDGFRSLATNGVDKPVLNVFRMFGMMQGERVAVRLKDPVTARDVMKAGVRGERSDINALASRSESGLYVMVWNYHDDDLPAPDAPIEIRVKGIPAQRALLHHYRIDDSHSNSFTVWREMGAPQQVTRAQYAALEQAGQLELLSSPKWVDSSDGEASIAFELARQGISFLELTW